MRLPVYLATFSPVSVRPSMDSCPLVKLWTPDSKSARLPPSVRRPRLRCHPTTQKPEIIEQTLLAVIDDYATHGVPPDLVEAAKRSEVASFDFERNPIPGLASLWSQALAVEGRTSPEQDTDAIQSVTVQDVNRVARQYLVKQPPSWPLRPSVLGPGGSSKGFGGAEKVAPTPTKSVALPPWAESLTENVRIPEWNLHPVVSTLPNGIQLIVETESLTPTITVTGQIRQEPALEVPHGQEGVASVLDGLFSYGTTTLDRLAFQKALDDIAANESAGASFELQVLKPFFDRGLQLLAQNELNPALPSAAFEVVQQQTAQSVTGLLQTPDYRANRVLLKGLLPAGDPALRQPTPQEISGLTLQEVHNYYHKTFVLTSPHRGDW